MMKMIIPPIFDAHIHLRRGAEMRSVIRPSLESCRYAIVMPPNRGERVDSLRRLRRYKREVYAALKEAGLHKVSLSFALEISDVTRLGDLRVLEDHDVNVVKVYLPRIRRDGGELIEILRISNRSHHAKICIHGVDILEPGGTPEYLGGFLTDLMRKVPSDAIVLEHVHTIPEIEFVIKNGLHATITAHHLILTREDSLADPEFYCHPLPGLEDDRLALIDATGRPDFMFGSDSDPNPPAAKREDPPAPGVYSAPYHLQILGRVIGHRADIEMFTSGSANMFYSNIAGHMVDIWDHVPDNVEKILKNLR